MDKKASDRDPLSRFCCFSRPAAIFTGMTSAGPIHPHQHSDSDNQVAWCGRSGPKGRRSTALPFPWNVGGQRPLRNLAALACPAHAHTQGHFLGSGQIWWDQGCLGEAGVQLKSSFLHPPTPSFAPASQPQPATICYFLLYPKNYKQKSFPQANSKIQQ
ncbi:hypothetical protein H1C71_028000 [Ictidomys tridecemlineatus]|nr:hypothetical protein H1C71_028000 [Ictidomys tridecemlineatus]